MGKEDQLSLYCPLRHGIKYDLPSSPPAISGSHTLGRKHHEQMMMAQQQQQQQQGGAPGHGHHPHGSATMRPMNTHTLGRLPSHHHHSPQHGANNGTG